MLYAVLFEDDPEVAGDARATHMPAHLAFLEANAEAIRAAGPLLPEGDGATGGLWLVEAEGREAVQALVEADPFWPTGLRRSHRVLAWRRVFAEGRRIIPG